MQISTSRLQELYAGDFADYRAQSHIAEWRRGYLDFVETVAAADRETWVMPEFQKLLWDSDAVSSIGPGQSVTVVGAYTDEALALSLLDAREALDGLDLAARGEALQDLYDSILDRVYPAYTPRRPRARIVRLLAAMFPDAMTCLMDKRRIWAVQRAIGAPRLPGGFVAQHPAIRDALRHAIGAPASLEDEIDRSIFTWFLWETEIEQTDDGAVVLDAPQRKSSAVPAFSLLPATAQRRSLACVRDNITLLQAVVREAEHGITREDLVSVIVSEATQLNASSAGNIISQALGGLGILQLQDGAYRPTERGQELLTAEDPAQALRGALVGRVFGMGHLLLMLRRAPGTMGTADAARALQDLVPTWTTTLPGSHIVSWAKLSGLAASDKKTGTLTLTDEGEDYAAALPEHFEEQWRIADAGEVETDGPSLEPARLAGAAARASTPYSLASIVEEGCFLEEAALSDMLALLQRRKNIILQGPPGTGKTWLAKRLGYALIGAADPSRLLAVQFQPTLSYEDFVRGWRPDGKGGLLLADGAFLDAVAAANAEPERPFVLVIEEVNRGNPAQILGELLTLIEDSKRVPEEALRLAYPRSVDERVHVPANLHIIGTMNLADRTLALVDLALRRRFGFIDLAPALGKPWQTWCTKLGAPAPLLGAIAARIDALNRTIAEHRALGPQYRVGHSFVTPVAAPGKEAENWERWYSSAVRHEIAPLLREYWYDDTAAAEEQLEQLLRPF